MNTPCLNTCRALAMRSVALFTTGFLICGTLDEAQAQGRGKGQKVEELSVVPTITEISLDDDGQLVASGGASLKNKGKGKEASFSNVSINISLAEDQTGATDCPFLDIELESISMNLQGLIVETGPVCLNITGYDEGEELGELLCELADLLDPELPLDPTVDLTEEELAALLPALEDLLNEALASLSDAVITEVGDKRGRTGGTLSLELEAAETSLLGLEVSLDDCEDGPVTVEITARRGQLLGNALSGLLKKGGIEEGDTLGDLVEALQNRR
jgi:hypothetical protein